MAEKGHEVEWVGGWVIATIDKDFGDLIHLGQTAPCSILRLVGFRAVAHGPALVSLVEKYEAQLLSGALITAEPWRVRVRRFSDA